jgi:pimeloyl-ACP methyl ester carboxylesterase
MGSEMWQSQIQMLNESYRVVAYDLRGQGRSDTGDGQFTIEFLVDDLIALLDILKLKSAVLCGLSMGGYVALRASERYPDRVSGLILCDTKSEADTNESKLARTESIKAVKKDGVRSLRRTSCAGRSPLQTSQIET